MNGTSPSSSSANLFFGSYDLDLSSLMTSYGNQGLCAISYIKERLAAESLSLSYCRSTREFTILGSAFYKNEDLSLLLKGKYRKWCWMPSLLPKLKSQNCRFILVSISTSLRVCKDEIFSFKGMFELFLRNISAQAETTLAVDWFFKKFAPPGSFQKKIEAPEFNPASFLYHFGIAGVNTLAIMKHELEKKSMSLAYSEPLRAFIIQGSYRFEKEEIEAFLKKDYFFFEPKVIGRNHQRNFVVWLAKMPYPSPQRRAENQSDLFSDEDLGASLWEEKKKSILERYRNQKQNEITQHLKKFPKLIEISASVAKIASSTIRAKVIKDFSSQMFKIAEFIDQILLVKQILSLQDYSVPKDKNKISKAISWFFKTYAPPGYFQKRIEGTSEKEAI